jgi:predicted kinase
MQKVKSLSTVIFVMGLPRSGKTFLGKHLSSALGATHISSDRVRKALQTKGKYQSKDKDDLYHEMKNCLKMDCKIMKTLLYLMILFATNAH